MISDVIRNTVRSLRSRASEGTLSQAEFAAGMEVFESIAADVQILENSQVPTPLTLQPEDLAEGKVVPIRGRW